MALWAFYFMKRKVLSVPSFKQKYWNYWFEAPTPLPIFLVLKSMTILYLFHEKSTELAKNFQNFLVKNI